MFNPSEPFNTVSAVVAIPVRDEAERIVDCLLALARQDGGPPGVLLLVNNTTDDTLGAVAEATSSMDMPIVTVSHVFGPTEAHAGSARRMAMTECDRLTPEGIPLLCTDADGRAAPDWLAANLFHLRQGIDAVFGRAEIDPIEAARIPPLLHQADRHECDYAAALDEIEHWIDPDPYDPWPRHTEQSGASIGVSRAAYRDVGGIPLVPLGEDRAFAAALRGIGARIRHAPEARVVVSGRILGRAVGGMADTIRRRLVAPDLLLDDALEPVADRVLRLQLRRAARTAFLVGEAGPGSDSHQVFATARSLEEAYMLIDQAFPPQRLAVADLPEQMGAARRVLVRLRPALQSVSA